MEPADEGDARAHAFVADLDAPELSAPDRHHLDRVLRLRPGEVVTVADGEGRWRRCVVRAGASLVPDGPVVVEPEPAVALRVGFALVKGDRPERVVQQLTELGIDVILPFAAERSVVRWDAARAERQHARLRSVAREAAMQCRRARLPVVEAVAGFAEVAARPGAVLADRDGEAPLDAGDLILVGPEGGWSDGERAAGLPRVRLPGRVLRSETAAVTAGVVLASLRTVVKKPQRSAESG